MSSEAILRFENISKNINRTEILKNINFKVERGEVVGIIGKNGSGKTTLLKLASGLSYPTKGEIYFFDKKLEPGFVGRLPQNIGVLIETPSFISNLSGFDNLYYLSKIRNIISKDDITPSRRWPSRCMSGSWPTAGSGALRSSTASSALICRSTPRMTGL